MRKCFLCIKFFHAILSSLKLNLSISKKRHLISQMPLGIIVIESKSDATSDLPSEIIKCYKNSIPKLPTVRDAISFY